MPRDYESQDTLPTSLSRRLQQAQILEQYHGLRKQGLSAQQAAQQLDLSDRTLRFWDAQAALCEDAADRFFTSPQGLRFLHRLLIALHFLVLFRSFAGLRSIALLLSLTGLDRYLANSYGTHHKISVLIRKALVAFGKAEFKRLSGTMPFKMIALAFDETFLKGLPLLVCLELSSNFILFERFAENRSAETWVDQTRPALDQLHAVPLSSTTDRARALKAQAAVLGLEDSPDLAHVTADACQAVVLPLVQAAGKACQTAADARQACERASRAPECEALRRHAEQAQVAAERACEQQRAAQEALSSIKDGYHPVDLESGEIKTLEQVKAGLTASFESLETLAERHAVGTKRKARLAKARRVMPAMLKYMSFYLDLVETLRAAVTNSATEASLWSLCYVGAYLALVARRTGPAEKRKSLANRSASLLAKARALASHSGVSAERLAELLREARELASVFSRSSSALEGRNGYLSLWWHAKRRLGGEYLEALSVVHNYWIRREDGTTAAERLFGQAPRDLFEYLLEAVAELPRPAKKRTRTPNTLEAAA